MESGGFSLLALALVEAAGRMLTKVVSNWLYGLVDNGVLGDISRIVLLQSGEVYVFVLVCVEELVWVPTEHLRLLVTMRTKSHGVIVIIHCLVGITIARDTTVEIILD